MAEVLLPRSLLALFPGAPRRLTAEASTVRELIDVLDGQVPGLADRVLESETSIRRHLNVFVDGEVAGLDARVTSGSTVHIIPAVSGG